MIGVAIALVVTGDDIQEDVVLLVRIQVEKARAHSGEHASEREKRSLAVELCTQKDYCLLAKELFACRLAIFSLPAWLGLPD